MSWINFHKEFKIESDCCDWLFRTRWPNGFCCPQCGGRGYWRISTRGLFKCMSCRHQVSLTAGTIFHKTRTSLLKWFIWNYCPGLIISLQTQKQLLPDLIEEYQINTSKVIYQRFATALVEGIGCEKHFTGYCMLVLQQRLSLVIS